MIKIPDGQFFTTRINGEELKYVYFNGELLLQQEPLNINIYGTEVYAMKRWYKNYKDCNLNSELDDELYDKLKNT